MVRADLCRSLIVAGPDLLAEAARAVRSELPELAPETWRDLDRRLAALLAEASLPVDEIVATLDSQPAVRTWVAEFMMHGGPAETAGQVEKSGQQPPPGAGVVLLPPRYACPIDGLYVRYVTSARPVGDCPDHAVPLIRADR
jgi:hypothetical protein